MIFLVMPCRISVNIWCFNISFLINCELKFNITWFSWLHSTVDVPNRPKRVSDFCGMSSLNFIKLIIVFFKNIYFIQRFPSSPWAPLMTIWKNRYLTIHRLSLWNPRMKREIFEFKDMSLKQRIIILLKGKGEIPQKFVFYII